MTKHTQNMQHRPSMGKGFGLGHSGNTKLPPLQAVDLAPEIAMGMEPGTKGYLLGQCSVFVSPPYLSRGWHISIAHRTRYPTWDEIAAAWYNGVPDADNRIACMVMPKRDEYVNYHNYCFQVHELTQDDNGMVKLDAVDNAPAALPSPAPVKTADIDVQIWNIDDQHVFVITSPFTVADLEASPSVAEMLTDTIRKLRQQLTGRGFNMPLPTKQATINDLDAYIATLGRLTPLRVSYAVEFRELPKDFPRSYIGGNIYAVRLYGISGNYESFDIDPQTQDLSAVFDRIRDVAAPYLPTVR